MSAEQLALIAGSLLSLAVGYVPGLSNWYDGLGPVHKRLVMAGLIVAVGVGALALSCANLIAEVECSQVGVWNLLGAIVAALVGNQATYLISTKSK